jgi:amino acid transporter
VTYGATVALQQVAAMGSTIAYTFSVLALCVAKYKRPEIAINAWIPTLGFIICLILIAFCIRNFIITDALTPLIAFLVLLITGIIMFWFTNKQQIQQL